jgi:hypothetical protein
MTDILDDREKEKARATEAIGQVLSWIETGGREPDRWERAFLVQAISWLLEPATGLPSWTLSLR